MDGAEDSTEGCADGRRELGGAGSRGQSSSYHHVSPHSAGFAQRRKILPNTEMSQEVPKLARRKQLTRELMTVLYLSFPVHARSFLSRCIVCKGILPVC